MGYTFAAGDWMEPANDTATPAITDALHALLVARADELAGCTEGSDEERELSAITNAIDAYEACAVAWRQDRGRQGLTHMGSRSTSSISATDAGCLRIF